MTPRALTVTRIALGVFASAIISLAAVVLPIGVMVPTFWPITCVVLLLAVPSAIVLLTLYVRFLRKHATGSMWIEFLSWISGMVVAILVLAAIFMIAWEG